MNGLTPKGLAEVEIFRRLREDLECPECRRRYALLRKRDQPDQLTDFCTGTIQRPHHPKALAPYAYAKVGDAP